MSLFQIAGLRDVAFEIIKHRVYEQSRKPHKLRVMWYRVGINYWCMYIVQNIELTEEQWSSRTKRAPQ